MDEIEEEIINTYRVLARFNTAKRLHKKSRWRRESCDFRSVKSSASTNTDLCPLRSP